MSRSNRLANDKDWPHSSIACDDGNDHRWQPLSFLFETRHNGEPVQPDLEKGRVYCVCMWCHSWTYIETEWVGFFIPPGGASDD